MMVRRTIKSVGEESIEEAIIEMFQAASLLELRFMNQPQRGVLATRRQFSDWGQHVFPAYIVFEIRFETNREYVLEIVS